MSKCTNHYEELQVTRNASDRVIRAAYQTLAQQYHPDKFDGPASEAERIMKNLNVAYAILTDPIKRKEHDELLDAMYHERRDEAEIPRKKSDRHHERDADTKSAASTEEPRAQDMKRVKPRFDDMERQNGTQNNVGQNRQKLPSVRRGAGWGASIGATAFFLFGYMLAGQPTSQIQFDFSTFIFFVVSGALVGAGFLRHW